MIKDKNKRGVFDALLIKALGVEYIKFVISLSGSCKIPEGFPEEYGIRLYNEGIPAKVFDIYFYLLYFYRPSFFIFFLI